MFSQAPFVFKSFAAMIAKESLLLSMGYCVASQFTRWNKTVGAYTTFVGLFSRVCTSHVDCQISGCDAWKVTLWTSVRLLPRVGHFVFPYFFQAYWRMSALTALMRLYPCVSHNVGFQSTSLSGWVFALCTFVRLLPRMSDQVSFQISSNTKWFAALFTNALSNVQLGRMTCCIVHTYVISLQYESLCGF